MCNGKVLSLQKTNSILLLIYEKHFLKNENIHEETNRITYTIYTTEYEVFITGTGELRHVV